MISVIVPIYNTGPSLAKCIESILNSTYGDFELILVNDGSTDNSPELCREYCGRDGRVRLIDQENQGASAARNRGIESCRGEWVVFVDSDDSIFPDLLRMIAEEKSADLLIFDFTKNERGITDTAGRAEEIQRIAVPLDSGPDRADLIERLLRFWQLTKGGYTDLRAPWAKAFRKSVLDRHAIRFAPGLRVGEDALFNIEFILAAQSCEYIPVPAYWHRVRMGSISHSFVPDLLESFSLLQRGMRDVLTAHGMFPLLERAYAANTLENMAYLLIKGIFNPNSANTARENRKLCRQMREDGIYAAALKYNYKIGNLPRRILLGFFQLRCYWVVKIICRVCFFCMEQIDKRQEKQSIRIGTEIE